MAKCINENCFNGAFEEWQVCPTCALIRAATRDTIESGYSGPSLFGFTQFTPAPVNTEPVEWPDDLQDWVL